MNTSSLTAERLREVLDYNPETGNFVWKKRLSARAGVGEIAGVINGGGYRVIKIDKVLHLAHRLVWLYVYGEAPKVIDHMDGCPGNNRLSNLHNGTLMDNQHNRGGATSRNKTGFIGVSRITNSDKFGAFIGLGGRNKNLGTFNSPEEASRAYLAAKVGLHSHAPRLLGERL